MLQILHRYRRRRDVRDGPGRLLRSVGLQVRLHGFGAGISSAPGRQAGRPVWCWTSGAGPERPDLSVTRQLRRPSGSFHHGHGDIGFRGSR